MENIKRSKSCESLQIKTCEEALKKRSKSCDKRIKTTSSLRDFASKKEFANWTRSVLALTKAKDALQTPVEEKFKVFLKPFEEDKLNTFLNCLKTNDVKHIKKHITKNTTQQQKQTWTCSHTECEYIFRELLKIHSSNPTKTWTIDIRITQSSNQVRETTFKSDDKSSEYVWNIAHLYTYVASNDEEIACDSLAGLDIAQMIKLMKSCKLFNFDGCTEIYENVLTTRNELMHSSDNMTTERELKETFNLLYSLLKGYKDYPSCRDGIAELEQFEKSTLVIDIQSSELRRQQEEALRIKEEALTAERLKLLKQSQILGDMMAKTSDNIAALQDERQSLKGQREAEMRRLRQKSKELDVLISRHTGYGQQRDQKELKMLKEENEKLKKENNELQFQPTKCILCMEDPDGKVYTLCEDCAPLSVKTELLIKGLSDTEENYKV